MAVSSVAVTRKQRAAGGICGSGAEQVARRIAESGGCAVGGNAVRRYVLLLEISQCSIRSRTSDGCFSSRTRFCDGPNVLTATKLRSLFPLRKVWEIGGLKAQSLEEAHTTE